MIIYGTRPLVRHLSRKLARGVGTGLSFCASACLALAAATSALAAPPEGTPSMTVVVMDPLAAPLSCDCVRGYAQRQYDELGKFLEKRLGRPVRVVYSEDLGKVAVGSAAGEIGLVIGKRSLVEFDARECRLPVRPLAALTGKDGLTTLTGLFVVAKDDPAKSIADLKGYRILLGDADSAEKHSAAIDALRQAGVSMPKELETRSSCSEAALEVVETTAPPRAAAVISSYAVPLLEGCGTIDKGSLRIVGQTQPLPFITLFATDAVSPEAEKQILDALDAVGEDSRLRTALETKEGFRRVEAGSDKGPAQETPPRPVSRDWPQFRGPNRDGLSPWLPKDLSAVRVVWTKRLTGAGLSGLAATERCVVVADRDLEDRDDLFRCLDAATGEELWKLQYPAPGDLDYGNSPRATPLIHEGKVYLLGAFGTLHCVELAGGRVLWKKQLVHEFGAKLPTWGTCASPVIIDDKLIVNPGAAQASLAALDPDSGDVRWKAPGGPAAYASFLVATLGGVRQIVGYDAASANGWDLQSGKRLWRLVPPESGDFNVPTPLDAGGRLLLSTENNGARLHRFADQGRIEPEPIASHADLAPDTTTCVLRGQRLYGCSNGLYCLDAASLKTVWLGEDEAFEDHVSLIASDDRLLVASCTGELLLVRLDVDRYELVGRRRVMDQSAEMYSHPALVGTRLYLRDNTSVACVELSAE